MMERSVLFLEISLLLMMCGNALCIVEWSIGQDLIVIGKPLKLNCELQDTLEYNKRQWRGGENYSIISVNGVTTNPAKYREIKISNRQYTLEINNTSEHDLNYNYSCRFGNQFSTKLLFVSPENLLAVPDEKLTTWEYRQDEYGDWEEGTEDKFTLNVNFRRVYPEPNCTVYNKGKPTKLIATRTDKHRILYDVSFHLETNEPLHDCENPVHIECTIGNIGNMTYRYNIPHKLNCNASIVWIVYATIFGILFCLFCIMFVCTSKHFVSFPKICDNIRKDRRRRNQGQLHPSVHYYIRTSTA